MKVKFLASLTAVFAMALSAFSADKIAIAEPINKGGMTVQDVEAVWSMLEATVDGGYEVISRSALKAMMTEIGLSSTDLVNPNSNQAARPGMIKTVKYLLVPTVGKFGSRINFSLIVVDASTGATDRDKRVSETYNSLDDMADRLKDALAEIGLGKAAKRRGTSALLTPIVKLPNLPPYVADDFNVMLEATLVNSGVRLQNLTSVNRILRKNNIDPLEEAEPAMYRRIGELLRVDYLIQANITRMACRVDNVYIEATRSYARTAVGAFAGNVRIVSAQTGLVVATIPFEFSVDFDDVDGAESWTLRDCHKYMVDRVIPDVAKAIMTTLR